MAKPDWLKNVEEKKQKISGFKFCISCVHRGKQCGYTNNLGNGLGKAEMYQCNLHPSVKFYFKSYGCEDYEHKILPDI